MSRSIYWKVTIPLIVLVMVIMGALGTYVVNSARDTQTRQLESQLLGEAKLAASISADAFADPARNGELDALAKRLGGQINARITLIAADGTVLGDTEQDPATMENHLTRPEVAAALASGTGETTRYSATLHENMMYVAVPVANQGKVVGISRVALPLTAVDSSINSTLRAVGGAVALATLLVILATAVLARMITRPVRQITAAAEAMASGKLDQQIQTKSDDEIGRLSNAFNRMSLNIRATLTAAADERSRLAAILASLTDGVAMTDAEGKILLANPAAGRLFEFNEEKVTGRPLIEAVQDHEIDDLLKKCLATGQEQTAELLSLRGRFVRAVAVPITAGEMRGALVLFQNLTEMRTLQTMRREFVGNISHELRTPLTVIKAIAETLRDGAIDDRQAAVDFLDRLDVEVDGLTQMVNELIELTRIETGKIQLKQEPVNLNQLVEDVIGRLGPQAERQQMSLSSDLTPSLPTVPADKDRIRQVLTSIVHNAIKFTPPGGRITVSTKLDGQWVVTQVSDTGIGISKEDLPHIFERFFKADRSRSTSGSGLGLAIAKHTVQTHGGSVWVRSDEGKGSIFGFNLPLHTPSNP